MMLLFDKQLFFYLFGGFVVFTIVGTISHELGHYLVACYLGHEASFNYASTFTPGEMTDRDSFLIILGGTLQTLVTGTLGFGLTLFFKNNFYISSHLKLRQWLLIFLSLFWLRELFIFLKGIMVYLFSGIFPFQNDEARLASAYGFAPWVFSLPLAIIAGLVVSAVVFKFIPAQQRLTFLVSLVTGSTAGFVLWMKILGPAILP